MILVDTSVWIPYLAGYQTPEVGRLLGVQQLRDILVGDLILMEILRGARSEAAASAIEREMSRFDVRTISDQTLAVRAATNYRTLRGLGITVRSSIDVLIATYCIENDHQLLHRDRYFEHFNRHLGLKSY